MVFFASGLFFDDSQVAKSRKFRDSDEMNRAVIEGWNRVVLESDTVYIIGGVGEFEYLKSLNGKKILLFSKHESAFFNTYVSGVTTIRNQDIDREMFEEYVSNNYGIKRVNFNKRTVIKIYSGREISMTANSDGLDLDRFNLVSTFDTVFGYYKLFLRNQLRCFNVDISNNLLHPVSEHDIEEVCKTVAKDLGYR